MASLRLGHVSYLRRLRYIHETLPEACIRQHTIGIGQRLLGEEDVAGMSPPAPCDDAPCYPFVGDAMYDMPEARGRVVSRPDRLVAIASQIGRSIHLGGADDIAYLHILLNRVGA